MEKRKRRKAREIRRIREQLLKAVRSEGTVSLTHLVDKYGSQVGVKNTPSDKNLVKRQLDQLAKEGSLQFERKGRDLVASIGPLKGAEPVRGRVLASPAAAPAAPGAELDVLKAYALQLEEFSKTLQEQISGLVRLIEKSPR